MSPMMRVVAILAITANVPGVAVDVSANQAAILRREGSIMRKDIRYGGDVTVATDATDAPTSAPTAGGATDAPTEAPAGTTAGPAGTTAAPAGTTAAPNVTTAAPGVNNDLELPGTTAGPLGLGGPPAVAPHTLHAERNDISYNYKEEVEFSDGAVRSGACEKHYEYMGDLTNEECAKVCYETYGCVRFSAGGCKHGCRISVPAKNDVEAEGAVGEVVIKTVAVEPDKQCIPGTANGCIVYQLSFFHAVAQPGACTGDYELKPEVETKAQCAHACKNHGSCKTFSHEPNCMYGCRISTSNTSCTKDTTMGCAMYELHQALHR